MGRLVIKSTLQAGTVLAGKLRVERVVGQGSMGIVLEATDLLLQRRVAVKVMSPERANNEEARKRFLREARTGVRLSNEHVTRLIDVGELNDGTPYIIMEYLVGSTLEQLLFRDGLPAVDVAVDWVLQALEGVAEAHRLGIVHRDLKPANLFLAERPNAQPLVKVLDFGAVKDLVTKGTQLTRTGATMGSPAYMSPEQVRAEDIDQRTDVWAMGVTLYELITGKLPFGGESVPQTLAAILRETPVPLRVLRPDASAELEGVINCTLSKDPASRYPSAAELFDALSMVQRSVSPTVSRTTTVHLGQTLQLSRHDEFADTAEMHRFVEPDASRVRPRVLVNTRSEKETVPERKEAPREHKARSQRWPLVLGAVSAVVMGAIGGAFLSRRHAPAPAPTLAITADPPSAPVAPLPTTSVTAANSSPSPATITTTASSHRDTASSPQRRPPVKSNKR